MPEELEGKVNRLENLLCDLAHECKDKDISSKTLKKLLIKYGVMV